MRFIREKQEVKADVVVDAYNFSWTDKRLKALWGAVGESLVEADAAAPCKAGLLGKQTGYQPAPGVVQSVVEQMRGRAAGGRPRLRRHRRPGRPAGTGQVPENILLRF